MAFEVTLVPKESIELGFTEKAVFTLSNVTPTIPVPGPKGDKGDKGDTGPQGPQGLPGTGVNSTDDIPEGTVNLYYTNTRVQSVIDAQPAKVSSVAATSPLTSSGGTTPTISTSIGTNKLVGRSSAGTGVMEEIAVGSGLQLVDGSLSTVATPGSGITKATSSGTDTYTTTITGVTAYTDGDAYLVRFTNGNTTGATININSLGAKTLYRNNDGALIGGDIIAGAEMLCIYNSALDGFQCIGTSPNTLLAYVTNAESTTITKGQPVYAFGAQGDRLTVKLAYNTGDSTSAQTVGIVLSSSIGANQKGFIIVQGQLDGLNIFPTSNWADGDAVYLGATAGTLTKTKPSAPNHLVYLGFVTTASNGAAGRMYVRVQNGYEMDELHDVQSSGAANKDILYRDTTVSPNLWKPAQIPTILGYTPEPAITAGTTAQYWRGDKSWQTLDKSAVGLGNVDNTSDATKNAASVTLTNKIISGSNNTISNIAQSSVTNLTTDLAAKLNANQKGIAGGVAELDTNGLVPAAQLPSYVDDVLVYANFAALPGTGESGKIYITENNNLTYRWSGSAYVEISASLALGTTASTAFRGDWGNTAYVHSQTLGNPHGTTKSDIGLSNVDNTSDANKPISTATQTALNAKQNTITLTTTGSNGAATLISNTLNIPNYTGVSNLSLDDLTAEGGIGVLNSNGTGVTIPLATSSFAGIIGAAQFSKLDGLSTSRQLPPLGSTGQVLGKISGTDYAVGWIDNVVDGSVTFAKMANISNNTLIGRTTSGSGVPESIGIGAGLAMSSLILSNTLTVGSGSNQTVIGGGNASGTLTLSSTSNATKGKILFGTSAYDEVNNRLGIGTQSPTNTFHISQNLTASSGSALIGLIGGTLTASANSDTLTGISTNITFSNAAYTGVNNYIQSWSNAGTLRSFIRSTGVQQWNINSGSAEAGNIQYGSPSGNTGFAIFDWDTTNSVYFNRYNIANEGTYFYQGYHNINTLGGFALFNTTHNVVIGYTGTPTDSGYKLDVNGTTRVAAGTLTDGGNNALRVTATMPTTITANTNAVDIQVTSAGSSSFAQRAVGVSLLAGYTGSGSTLGLDFNNSAAGTGNSVFTNRNQGVFAAANGTTTGTNIGIYGSGTNGDVNYGAIGRTITAKNSAKNIGVAGFSLNTGTSPVQIGGYFGLQNTDPTLTSAALMADNGATTDPIFVARDNGTAVFTIADGGNVGIGTTSPTSKLHITAGTLTDLVPGMYYSATMPTTISALNRAVFYEITSAGSSSQTSRGVDISYLSGYTGSGSTSAFNALNSAAGTNGFSFANLITVGNFAVSGNSNATTTGTNIGNRGTASNGNLNIGNYGYVETAKNSATNIGVLGFGLNTGTSGIQLGGYFGLGNTPPTFASAALMCDNGSQTSPVFVARDNGTDVFTIADGGTTTWANGINMAFATTTGTKIGTATGQKLAFWNKTPIVQPTTASAAAAFTANTGTAVNDASTFGGYTLRQIAQALIDIGILA